MCPPGKRVVDAGRVAAESCKLQALRCMVEAAASLGERLVCVSTSTRMLDAAQAVCEHLGSVCTRIDGATAPALRQDRVDAFNSPNSTIRVCTPPCRCTWSTRLVSDLGCHSHQGS